MTIPIKPDSNQKSNCPSNKTGDTPQGNVLEVCLQEQLKQSACSLELEDLTLDSSKSLEVQEKLFNSLKLTPTRSPSCDVVFPKFLSTTILEATIPPQSGVESFMGDSHASARQTQANERVSNIQSQISGLKCSESLSNADLNSSLSKILKDLSIEDYEQCLEDSEWLAIVGTIRSSYQQRSLERRSKETGYSLLPTPTTYAKGSGKCRPAGATKLEQSLRQFISKGDKLHPAVPGWMMGFPPGWVEEVLMDGGLNIQLPFTPECVITHPSVENATTCMLDQSCQSWQRSPCGEFFPCTSFQPQTLHLNEESGVYGWLLGDINKNPSKNRRRKGEGNGSIYWRTLNRNGKDYPQAYYHWRENGRKRTKYIPKQVLGDIQAAEAAKRPVIEILGLLGVTPLPSKNTLLGDTQKSPSTGEEQLEISPSKKSPSTTRRHKGDGSGSIHWKTITRNGFDYPQAWYHYEFWDKGERLVKKSKYIPKRLEQRIQKLEEEKAPVREILNILGVKL
jgi:hypothetical protein